MTHIENQIECLKERVENLQENTSSTIKTLQKEIDELKKHCAPPKINKKTNNSIEELEEHLHSMMDTAIDNITGLQNILSEIKKREQCAPDLIQTGIKSPETNKKKKTITAIDLGWQKGHHDNCVKLTYVNETASVEEFDIDSITQDYDLAPEIEITLGAQKIHSKTLMDLLKMLTSERNYVINEYDFYNRSIHLHHRYCL